MGRNYETELPEGYAEVFCIDAKNVKTGIWMNVVGTLLAVVVFIPLYFLFRGAEDLSFLMGLPLIVFTLSLLLYLVLHELTHGAVYYSMTRQKLTYGLSLSCAYCGVPNIYVSKKTAVAAVSAPFVLFSLLFAAGMAFLPLPPAWKLTLAALFSLHFGGCVGDLYVLFLLLFHLKGDLLMRDTGPKQTFYARTAQKDL